MKIKRKRCLKCSIKRWIHTVKDMFSSQGIRFTDKVVATFYKDGKEIARVVGPKRHNKWINAAGKGLDEITECLVDGGTGNFSLKVYSIRLGTQCSDTGFTYIETGEAVTSNEKLNVTQSKFTATFSAESGPFNDICQACLRFKTRDTDVNIDGSYYNFGVAFNKPVGVSLKIEWTVTLSS